MNNISNAIWRKHGKCKAMNILTNCFIGILFLLAVLIGGCDNSLTPHLLGGKTMGTTYSIQYYGAAKPALNEQVNTLLTQLDNSLSTYKQNSDVSRFNAAEANQWFSVSPITAKIVIAAQKISRASNGAFDITVGPLVDLWGVGAEASLLKVPSETEIKKRLQYVGYELIEVKQSPPALKKYHHQTAIDLSSIAKGYAIDEVASLLDKQGIDSWLIEIGGEIRARGKKPGGNDWKIAIEHPFSDTHSVQKIIPLNNLAIATSGDYRNFFEHNNVRYSHSINPQNGWPVPNTIGSVSVLRADAMTADAWATAMLILGEQEAIKHSINNDLAISMTARNKAGNLREVVSPAFAKHLASVK
jgi:FAD:protein FMN transferase